MGGSPPPVASSWFWPASTMSVLPSESPPATRLRPADATRDPEPPLSAWPDRTLADHPIAPLTKSLTKAHPGRSFSLGRSAAKPQVNAPIPGDAEACQHSGPVDFLLTAARPSADEAP